MTLDRIISRAFDIDFLTTKLLLQKGVVYVNGIQRTDPDYVVTNRCVVNVSGLGRAWVTF